MAAALNCRPGFDKRRTKISLKNMGFFDVGGQSFTID